MSGISGSDKTAIVKALAASLTVLIDLSRERSRVRTILVQLAFDDKEKAQAELLATEQPDLFNQHLQEALDAIKELAGLV
jgi:hypothetical protein